MERKYYAIVTFGVPAWGQQRSYYRSLDRALADARTLGGGSLTNVRVVEASSRADAINADISDSGRVIYHV